MKEVTGDKDELGVVTEYIKHRDTFRNRHTLRVHEIRETTEDLKSPTEGGGQKAIH